MTNEHIEDKLHRLAVIIGERLGSDWSMLSQRKITVAVRSVRPASIDDIDSIFNNTYVVAKATVHGDVAGGSTMIFNPPGAIILGNVMMAVDDEKIALMKDKPYAIDTAGSFSETIRIMWESLGNGLSEHLRFRMSFEGEEPRLYDFSQMDSFKNAGLTQEKYYLVNYGFTVDGFEEGTITQFFLKEFTEQLASAAEANNSAIVSENELENHEQNKPKEDQGKKVLPNLERILRITLPLSVVIAEKKMKMEEIKNFAPGTVIEFDKSSDGNLDLKAQDKVIGRGEGVKVGEKFGIRIQEIGSIKETIKKLGEREK